MHNSISRCLCWCRSIHDAAAPALTEFARRNLQAKYTAPGGPPPPVHTDTWWLDAVTRQMVEQRLNLSGMLTFTLRGGRPINLTREQASSVPSSEK